MFVMMSLVTDDCNETRDFLPCNDGLCYLREQRCDGVMQCEDGVDEMGCKCAVHAGTAQCVCGSS